MQGITGLNVTVAVVDDGNSSSHSVFLEIMPHLYLHGFICLSLPISSDSLGPCTHYTYNLYSITLSSIC
jgi:hypothetical protein